MQIKRKILSFLILFGFLNPLSIFAEELAQPVEKTIAGNESVINLQLKHLQALSDKNDWSSIIKESSEILKKDQNQIKALAYRAKAFAENQNLNEAIDDHLKLTQLAPKESRYWTSLCWCQILIGKFKEARPSCEIARNINPRNFAATVNLGHTYLLIGDINQAKYWYKQTIPLIESDNDLRQGPLTDFDIFIRKGWQIEFSKKEKAWFKEVSGFWLIDRKEMLNLKAKVIFFMGLKNDILKAIEFQNQYLIFLENSLNKYDLGINHVCLVSGLNQLELLYSSLGRQADAEPLARRALIITENLLGPEHLETAIFQNNLAKLLNKAGHFTEAESLYRHALSIREKALGPNHSVVANSLNNLAALLETTGNYTEAESLYRRALAIREKAFGPDHSDVANSLNNLAVLLKTIGNYTEAESLYRRALVIREKALGPDHSDVANSLNNLAVLLKTTGNYTEAESLYRRALAIREKVLGPNHSDVANSLNNLAALLETTGIFTEAESLYRRALAIREKALGSDHSDVANSLNNLATLQVNIGRYTEAELLYRRALTIKENAIGSEHPDVANFLNNIAELLKTTGRYAEAEPLYRRALAIREKMLGQEHIDVSSSLNGLAALLVNIGRYDEAEPLYRRALAIREKSMGPYHPKVADSLNDYATLLEKIGSYAEVESQYKRALAIREKALDPEHPDIANSLNNLANLLRTTGRYAEAEPLYRRALAIREKMLGQEHIDVSSSLNGLATLLVNIGRYDEAEPLYRKALAIDEKALGFDHAHVALSLNNLAGLLEAKGDSKNAEPLYHRALAIQEKALGSNHPDFATLLNNLGGLLDNIGRNTEAEQLYRRSLVIREKALGSGHPLVANSLNNLATLLIKIDRPSQAEPLLKQAYEVSILIKDPNLKWIITGNLRTLYFKAQPDLAILYGKQAVNTIQDSRANLKKLDKTSQEAFLKSVENYYKDLSSLLFKQGRIPEGQQVLAMLKEQEYFDYIRGESDQDTRTTKASYNGIEAQADSKLKAQEVILNRLGIETEALRKKKTDNTINEVESQRLSQLDIEIDKANVAFNQTLDEIKALFSKVNDKARYADLEKKQLDNDLRDVVSSFGSDVALLQYVVLDDQAYILMTSETTRLTKQVPLKKNQMNAAIVNFLNMLKQPSTDPRPAGQALYQLLIAPVEPELQAIHAKTLMLSLDGALRYVPMAALYDGKQYLAERYALALYTEAARERLKDEPIKQWKVAGLGITQAYQGFTPLPAVAGEMDAIVKTSNNQGLLPGSVQLDAQFTPSTFKDKLRDKNPVVHIASHFKFDPAGDTESFLLLGDGSKLSLKDIRTQSYTFSGVDLLTLSACETGIGGVKDTQGREVEGLGVLAQQKGAKGVIATLWSVADDSTGAFMREFYRLKQEQHLTKAEAMRQTQVSMLKGTLDLSKGNQKDFSRGGRVQLKESAYPIDPKAPYAHPYYWAPFILMGNWL